jgi:hypothetical protein
MTAPDDPIVPAAPLNGPSAPEIAAGNTAYPDADAPTAAHRQHGARTIVLVLLAFAAVGVVVYLFSAPGRRELARFSDRVTTSTPAPDTANAPAAAPPAPSPEPSPSAAAAPATTPPAPAPTEESAQLAKLKARVDALEQRVAALAAQPAGQPAAQSPPAATSDAAGPMVAALSARLDALSGRQEQIDAQVTQQSSTLKADDARLQAAANQAAAVAALTDRATRLAQIQAAGVALAQGQPLGALPQDAPPALTRFQSQAPPTEAQLTLAFPAVAAQARAATRPDTGDMGFWRAMRARAESLITVQRGDHVLVGNPQIALIDQAHTALAAGDLAGAVHLLGGLAGPAAAPFADWRARAQALLDGRAALSRLANKS